MAFNPQKTESTLAEINVVPLVDVMLVLLIIFMITAPMIQHGLDVSVPKTKSGNVIPEERLIITISKDNELWAEGMKDNKVGLDQVPDLIGEWFAKRNVADDERTIYVRADGEVSYASLMAVIDAAKLAGVERVGLVTEPRGVEEQARDKGKKP